MNKHTLAIGITLVLGSAYAGAQEVVENEVWGALFGEYYSAYPEKFAPDTAYGNGLGYGAEIGIRLNPDWGVRFEFSHLDLDAEFGSGNITGEKIGIDGLYYIQQSNMYMFAGVKNQSLEESYQMANLGLGAHWQLSDRWKVVTEAAAYYEFGEGNPEYSYKLGLAYSFSKTVASRAPSDADNDGVIDARDLCPNTPYGAQVDSDGCVLPQEADTDNDGVLDANDECANTPAGDRVDSTGCSMFTENQVAKKVEIFFANNSAKLTNVDTVSVQEFVDFMQSHPQSDAVIEGYASAPGEADYNMALSVDRALAVKALLVENYAIAPERLETEGYGETRLLDSSNTVQAHKINRRVEANATAIIRTKVKK
jgi:OOP family OmpA-OmpF porin